MCYYAVRDTAMEKNKIELDGEGKYMAESLQQNHTDDLN